MYSWTRSNERTKIMLNDHSFRYTSNGCTAIRSSTLLFIILFFSQLSLLMGTESEPQAVHSSTDQIQAELTIASDCTPPDWSVDIGIFEYTMTMIGVIFFDNVESVDANDIVAAFVGEECRGIAKPTEFPVTGRYTFGMTIYSNTSSGETITFKAFDFSQCEILDVTETFTFESDRRIGTDTNPEELHAVSTIVRTISLNQGWNWISVNVENDNMDPDVVLTSIVPNGDFIKNQTSFAAYYGDPIGWYSSNGLDVIDPKHLYKLHMTAADVLDYEGVPVDVDTPIPLSMGWNWIGFLPQVPMALETALASIVPNGIFIKSQIAFSTYYTETGWYSSNGLVDMEPGVGYMLKMAADDELVYGAPAAPLAKNVNLTTPLIAEAGWSLDVHAYEHSMAVTGVLQQNGHEYKSEQFLVGAFVGDECRGISRFTPFPLNGRYEFGMLVFGRTGEDIRFKVIDLRMNKIIECEQKMPFAADGIVGSGYDPYVLQLAPTALSEIPSNYQLYQNFPNPFNPKTTIAYDVPQEGKVRLQIFDVRGQLVRTLESGDKIAGRYESVWDGRNQMGAPAVSGLYFCKLTCGDFSDTIKMIVAK